MDQGAEVPLEDTVQLERLARGEFECAVGVRVGEGVEREPLLGRADAAGHADARHEGKRLFLALLATLFTEVAVVLRVDAVESQELSAVLGDAARRVVLDIVKDVAAEGIAPGFQHFVFVQRFGGRRRVFRSDFHKRVEFGVGGGQKPGSLDSKPHLVVV